MFWSVLRDGIIAPLAVLHENILLHINPLQISLLQAICKVFANPFMVVIVDLCVFGS